MNKGYVLVDAKGKRIRELDGVLTPYFSYPQQAIRFIITRLDNSPGVHIHKVGK